MFKLTSLNLNGIRSATSKGLEDWIAQSLPDCICVQELKAQATDVSGRFEALAGLKGYFHFAEKKGYSGVAVYTRHEPSDVIVGYGSSEFDAEGRYVELRFDRPGRKHAPKLSIISCYFPSGSSGEERQAAKFRFLAEFYPRLLALKETRDFVLCGDVNIAHQEIDLKNFKGNRKNSGFLPEERAWMTELLKDAELANEAADELNAPTLGTGVSSLPPKGAELARGGPSLHSAPTLGTGVSSLPPEGAELARGGPSLRSSVPTAGTGAAPPLGGGMVDVYRKLQPTTTDAAYTWWSNRGQAYAKNVGWRLDYHLATPAFAALARSEHIYRAERFSDHAPITVDYDWSV